MERHTTSKRPFFFWHTTCISIPCLEPVEEIFLENVNFVKSWMKILQEPLHHVQHIKGNIWCSSYMMYQHIM